MQRIVATKPANFIARRAATKRVIIVSAESEQWIGKWFVSALQRDTQIAGRKILNHDPGDLQPVLQGKVKIGQVRSVCRVQNS